MEEKTRVDITRKTADGEFIIGINQYVTKEQWKKIFEIVMGRD